MSDLSDERLAAFKFGTRLSLHEQDDAAKEILRLRAAVSRVRELAEDLAKRAPADDWGNDIADTVVADVGRAFLEALGDV